MSLLSMGKKADEHMYRYRAPAEFSNFFIALSLVHYHAGKHKKT